MATLVAIYGASTSEQGATRLIGLPRPKRQLKTASNPSNRWAEHLAALCCSTPIRPDSSISSSSGNVKDVCGSGARTSNGSIEVLHTERKTAQQQAQLQADLETFVDRIRGPLATLDFDARQQLVRTVIERVMVEDGRVDIHYSRSAPARTAGPDGAGVGVLRTVHHRTWNSAVPAIAGHGPAPRGRATRRISRSERCSPTQAGGSPRASATKRSAAYGATRRARQRSRPSGDDQRTSNTAHNPQLVTIACHDVRECSHVGTGTTWDES